MQESRLLDLFCELVRIESPSFHECSMALLDASPAARARVRGELRRFRRTCRLGYRQPRRSSSGNEGGARGVFGAYGHRAAVRGHRARRRGRGRALGGRHHPVGRRQGRRGRHLRGRAARPSSPARLDPDVTVLLTTCEEQHLLGSSALADGLLPAGAPCYVLDADGAPGTIITGALCHWSLNATFSGRAAHAGVCPEEGVSAIAMAAAAVSSMPLGRLDEATTANVGFIEGGGATNVVPDTCALAGECRSLYAERAEARESGHDRGAGGRRRALRRRGEHRVDEELRRRAVRRGGRTRAGHRPRLPSGRPRAAVPSLRRRLRCQRARRLRVRPVTLGVGMAAFHSVDDASPWTTWRALPASWRLSSPKARSRPRATGASHAGFRRRCRISRAPPQDEGGRRGFAHLGAFLRRSTPVARRRGSDRAGSRRARCGAVLHGLCSPPPSASRPTTWSPPTNGLPERTGGVPGRSGHARAAPSRESRRGWRRQRRRQVRRISRNGGLFATDSSPVWASPAITVVKRYRYSRMRGV